MATLLSSWIGSFSGRFFSSTDFIDFSFDFDFLNDLPSLYVNLRHWLSGMDSVVAVYIGILALIVLLVLYAVQTHRTRVQALRLSLLVHNAPVMIRAHDRHGVPLFWNRECERVTGYPAHRIVNNSDSWTLLYPDPALRDKTAGMRKAPARDYTDARNPVTCADGSTRIITWFSISESHPIPGWYSWETGLDITEQQAAAEALKERDLRQKAILDNIPDVAWLKDRKLRLVAVNRRFCTLMQRTEHALLGRTIMDFWPAEFSGPCAETDRLVLREGRPLWQEERIPSSSSEEIWHETFRTPIYGTSGEIIGIAGIGRDITEKRKTARELLLAKQRAEEANKTKSEFLANMSHEIRTPLNGILGMLQLMTSTPMTEEQSTYIRTAITSSRRLSRLLADILDISKIEAGQMEIIREPFAIRELQEALQDIFQLTANRTGVPLRVRIAEDVPPYLMGDEARLRQIIFNLVGNAFKFTTRGSVSVDIDCLRKTTEHCRLLITVTDTGAGIPGSMQDKIFDSFTQVEGSASRSHGGVGLGLAIVRRLIHLMNANLAISSAPGEGTEICISLPLDIARHYEQRAEGAKAVQTSSNPLRFLVAEDDQINQLAITRLLEKKGHRVHCVANGLTLLEEVKSGAYDMVLMDVQMPGMDGIEATRHIRLLPEFERVRTIPIIALTACAMSGDRERFLRSGMDGYIPKPVDWNMLSHVIAVVAEKRRARKVRDLPRPRA